MRTLLTTDPPEELESLAGSARSKTNFSGSRRRVILLAGLVPLLLGAILACFRLSTDPTLSADLGHAVGYAEAPPVPADPEGSTNGDAVPFPNIYYATLGYNIYYGDPLPVLKGTPSMDKLYMDPGLKKPLFQIEYTQGRLSGDRRHTQPDGYHATVDEGCSTVFSTKKIRSEYEYQTDQSQTVGMYARVEAAVKFPPTGVAGKFTKKMGKDSSVGVSGKAFARAGGTLSLQFRDMQNQNSLRDQEMYRSAAKCSSYVVAFSYAFPPKAHPDFQKAVDALGSSAQNYYKLFDDFGTHMLTTVKMGARFGTNSFVDRSSADSMEKTANGLGLTLEASVGAVAKLGVKVKGKDMGIKVAKKAEAKLPLLTPKEKVAAQQFQSRYVKKSHVSAVGPPLPEEGVSYWSPMVNQKPVPISWDDKTICFHPSIVEKDDVFNNCGKYLESYCDGHLKQKGAKCLPAAEKECYNDLDCKEDFVCRNWKCVAVPKCSVTIYRDAGWKGSKYTLPSVTDIRYYGGKMFDLENANWNDEISSIDLSPGCDRIEAIDDDGSCTLGKGDNGRYTTDRRSLPSDLDNDVCKIKVWAKAPPSGRRLSDEAMNASSIVPSVVLYMRPTNSRKAPKSPGFLTNTPDQLEVSDSVAPAPQPVADSEITEISVQPERRLQEKAVAKKYLKNIGKAMYGYNHYYGAPTSSDNAGTDPGFMHRPVWAVKYEKKNIVEVEETDDQPREKPAPTRPSWLLPAKTKHWRHYGGHYGPGLHKTAQWEPPTDTYCIDVPTTEKANDDEGFWEARNYQIELWDYQAEYIEKKQALDICKGIKSCAAITCHFRTQVTEECLLVDLLHVNPPTTPMPGTREWREYQYAQHHPAPTTTTQDFRRFHYDPRRDHLSHRQENDYSRYYEQYHSGLPKSSGYNSYHGYGGMGSAGSHHGYYGYQGYGGKLQMCRTWNGATVYIKVDSPPTTPWTTTHTTTTHTITSTTVTTTPVGYEDPEWVYVPDGWKVLQATTPVCESDFKTEEVKSMYDYEADMSHSMNPLGGRVDLGAFSFSLSSESKEFSKSNSRNRKAMYVTTAECYDFVAELDNENPPPTSKNFEFVVNAAETERDYYQIFDMYGLHYPTKVYFGAKYGFTNQIDEKSYKTVLKQSSSFSVSAEVTKGIKAKKDLSLSATAGVSYGSKDQTSESEKMDSYFSETREFSLGKRMPNTGGAWAWMQQVGGESMPYRYSLDSICNHPAMASRKGACEGYWNTYCEKHLTRVDETLNCDLPEVKECLFDLDCKDHHFCTDEGFCQKHPDCVVKVYSREWYKGVERTYGPVYYEENPKGKMFNVGGDIDSVKVSGGCAEVILLDEDRCFERYEDNIIIENRNSNDERKQGDLPGDLEDDVCKVKLIPKEKWV